MGKYNAVSIYEIIATEVDCFTSDRYLLRQGSKYELLDGLELLPLANGGFDVFHFNPKKADRPIYVVPSAEFQTLLPGLRDDFLEMDIDEDIKNLLVKAANRGLSTAIMITRLACTHARV